MNKLFFAFTACLCWAFSAVANTPNRSLPSDCDIITLLNGQEISGRVIEINPNDIIYRPCDTIDKRTVLIDKNDVFSIKYPDGKKEVIHDFLPKTYNPTKTKTGTKVEPLGLAGFIVALILVYASPVALVLGILSLSKIRREPERWRGSGFSIAATILGAIGTIILGIALSSMF